MKHLRDAHRIDTRALGRSGIEKMAIKRRGVKAELEMTPDFEAAPAYASSSYTSSPAMSPSPDMERKLQELYSTPPSPPTCTFSGHEMRVLALTSCSR